MKIIQAAYYVLANELTSIPDMAKKLCVHQYDHQINGMFYSGIFS